MERVLLYCQATAGLMMTELHKLPNESLLIKAGESYLILCITGKFYYFLFDSYHIFLYYLLLII